MQKSKTIKPIHSFLLLVLLCSTVVLYFKAYNKDYERHLETKNELISLQLAYKHFEKVVILTKYNYYPNFDEVVKDQRVFEKQVQHIIPILQKIGNPKITEQSKKLVIKSHEIIEVSENLKSNISILRNSISYLPTLIETIEKKGSLDLYRPFSKVRNGLFRYLSGKSKPKSIISMIYKNLAMIKKTIGEGNKNYPYLAAHLKNIIKISKELDYFVKEIDQINIKGIILQIDNLNELAYQEQNSIRRIYQKFFIAAVLITFLLLIYLFVSFKKTEIEVAEKDIIGNFLNIITDSNSKKTALESSLDAITTMNWLPVAPKAGIFLVSKDHPNQLSLYTTTANFSPELLTLCNKIDFGYCICGRAASAKEIMFVDCVDKNHDVDFDGMTPHGHYSVPFFDSDGEISGVLVLYVSHGHTSRPHEIDLLKSIANGLGAICQRFDQEEEALEANQLIQHQRKMASLGELSAGIGHEINNPLAVSVGNTTLIKKMLDKETIQNSDIFKNIVKIQNAHERIRKIVDGLRIYARSDTEHDELISMRVAIDSTVELVTDIYESEGIIIIRNNPDREFHTKGSLGKLQQVIMNLISNAKDATDEQSTREINLSLVKDKDHTFRFSVRDNGCGIPEDVKDKILKPFFTTKGVGKGTGMGLGLVAEIIKEMGGELEIESIEGEGSIFSVVLPLVDDNTLAEAQNKAQAQERVALKGIALVVDDEEGIRELLVDHWKTWALRLRRPMMVIRP